MNNFLRYFGNFRKAENGLREYVDYTGRKFILNPLTQKWESGGMVLSEQQMSMFSLQAFDDPSNGGKKLALIPIISLSFLNGLPDGVTFARSTAVTTYLGSNGYINRTTSANEPRFEYDSFGNKLGLLIEGQATNRLIDGITFYGNWKLNSTAVTNFGMTLLSNQGTSPENTNQANRLAINSPIGSEFSFISSSIEKHVDIAAGSDNASHVFSFWAKNVVGATYIAASICRSSVSQDKWFGIIADISGNTFKTFQATTAPGITFANLERYPNDWYRISLGTTASSSTGITACIGMVNSFNGSFSATGRPLNSSISTSSPEGFTALFWGAQVEANFSPSSFIPTNGSVVTRNADSASYDGITSTLGENPTNLTINFEFDASIPPGVFPYIGRLYDSTSLGNSGSYGFYIWRNATNKEKINFSTEIKSFTTQNGELTATPNSFTVSYTDGLNPKTTNKVALSYNPNIVSAQALRAVNGFAITSSQGVTSYPISLDKLSIGSASPTANFLNGHIQLVRIYDKTLPQTHPSNLKINLPNINNLTQ